MQQAGGIHVASREEEEQQRKAKGQMVAFMQVGHAWQEAATMAGLYWHVHTVTDEGVGTGQAHTGRLTVVYEK